MKKLQIFIQLEKPSNHVIFCYKFITMEIINQILTKHFNVPIPVKSASQWIGQDGWLGKSKMHRKNGEIKRGRWGWIMKDEYQGIKHKSFIYNECHR